MSYSSIDATAIYSGTKDLRNALPGLTKAESEGIAKRLFAIGRQITQHTPRPTTYGFETCEVGDEIVGDASDAGSIRQSWSRVGKRFPGVTFAGRSDGGMFKFVRTA